jgi:putative sigma-54 modulation protein
MNPPIEFTSRHEPVSERMRSYATEKVEKLLRFHNRISRMQMIIDGAHEEPTVELIVHVDSGATLVAKEHHEHFKGAVDLIVDKMERQLKKNNRKRKHHKSNGGPKAVPGRDEGGSDGEETYDDAVQKDLS